MGRSACAASGSGFTTSWAHCFKEAEVSQCLLSTLQNHTTTQSNWQATSPRGLSTKIDFAQQFFFLNLQKHSHNFYSFQVLTVIIKSGSYFNFDLVPETFPSIKTDQLKCSGLWFGYCSCWFVNILVFRVLKKMIMRYQGFIILIPFVCALICQNFV